MFSKKLLKASMPPAEAPTPTIGIGGHPACFIRDDLGNAGFGSRDDPNNLSRWQVRRMLRAARWLTLL
jgi:hypothetical protein